MYKRNSQIMELSTIGKIPRAAIRWWRRYIDYVSHVRWDDPCQSMKVQPRPLRAFSSENDEAVSFLHNIGPILRLVGWIGPESALSYQQNESRPRRPFRACTRLPRINDRQSTKRACDMCSLQSERRLPGCWARRWHCGHIWCWNKRGCTQTEGAYTPSAIVELVSRWEISSHFQPGLEV